MPSCRIVYLFENCELDARGVARNFFAWIVNIRRVFWDFLLKNPSKLKKISHIPSPLDATV